MPKTHPRLEAYGTVDELSAQLGLLATTLTDNHDLKFVQGIQQRLFIVCTHLATADDKPELQARYDIPADIIGEIEQEIDRIDAALPPLRAFVLPGGDRAAAVAHVCRTVCRRAERRILALSEQAEISPFVLSYVNRLSDYLFVLSRKLNHEEKKDEIFWNNPCG